MRPFSWLVVFLALLNAAFLASLPLLAENAADRLTFSQPEALPSKPQIPEQREEPVVPVEELHEALRLPRVDESPTDEHSKAAVAAYRDGDYERAFEEAVLALDPAPLEDNELYQALTSHDTDINQTVEKSNGRPALETVDKVLQSSLNAKDPQEAARLNNAAAMLLLYLYKNGAPTFPYYADYPGYHARNTQGMAEELAYQAADLQSSYCPALLNLTLLNGTERFLAMEDLEPAGNVAASWTDYYPAGGCSDPALLYYLAQDSISRDAIQQNDVTSTLRLIERLQTNLGWAGLAHSVRGDAYHWSGVYALERTNAKRPYTARRYFELALREYETTLRLQPDDPGLRNGKALTYLKLGESDKGGTSNIDKAIREATLALEAAPDSARFQQTLVEAFETKGDYAAAARANRRFLSAQQPVSAPLTLVPYSAISHGADSYSEFRVVSYGAGGGVLVDEEVIQPYTMLPEATGHLSFALLSVPYGLGQYRHELRYYGLLRDDLLSGNSADLREDLRRAPKRVRENERALLLVGMDQLLNQADGLAIPTPETQSAIDDFLALYEDVPLEALTYYGEPPLRDNDFFYREAGNFFRQYEQYDNAARVYSLWRTELEADRAGAKWRRAEVEKLLGEARFLNKVYDRALATFDRAVKLHRDYPPYMVRQAFMHEKLKEYGEAEDLYRRSLDAMRRPAEWMDASMLKYAPPAAFYFPENYQAKKHLGDVLLRQAASMEQTENNAGEARKKYSDAARTYREALKLGLSPDKFNAVVSTAAANNLGIALLMTKDYAKAIGVLESLTQPLGTPPPPWYPLAPDEFLNVSLGATGTNHPLVPDEHNPIFRLNLGWAYQRNGEIREARKQYLSAVKSDPSFYPALNDLGVLAARENDTDTAKGYFDAALEANSGYDHAAFNTGVALLRSGPENFLAAQHYFGRAVAENPALSETSYDYISDNELYILNLSLLDSVPADWRFSTHAQKSTGRLSLLVLALLLGRIAVGYARMHLQDTIIGGTSFYLRRKILPYLGRYRLTARLRDGLVRFTNFGVVSSGAWWTTPVALLASAPAIVIVMGWGLIRGDSELKTLMLGVLLYLVMVSLLVHHAGHALAGWWFKMRVQEAPWPAGMIPSLALAAIGGPAVAPVPANIIEGEREERERERSLIYLAGPVASMLFAVLLFVLFLFSHIPLLRLGAILNLAVAVVSLLLLPPLDGAMVGGGRYTRLLFWAGIAMTVLWAAVYFSNQLYCVGSPGDHCWGVWF